MNAHRPDIPGSRKYNTIAVSLSATWGWFEGVPENSKFQYHSTILVRSEEGDLLVGES